MTDVRAADVRAADVRAADVRDGDVRAADVRVADVLVIGGGIVGTSVAAAAATRGASVLVLEAGGPTEGTSVGNAGHLVPSHVVPFAAPGMVGAGMRSLVRRDDAFAVNPRGGRVIAEWLTRFVRSANPRNVERGAPVLAALLEDSLARIRALAAAGADLDLDESGLLQVFTSRRSWTAGQREAAVMRELGYPARELDAQEVVARESTVRGAVGGILLERDARLDPALLLAALRQEARSNGAEFVTGRALRLRSRPDGGASVSSTVGPLRAEQVVIAAGVWTPGLVRLAGGPALPIVAAKGYGLTVHGVGAPPRGPLLLMDQRLAVTPMRQGLRITGRYELTRAGDRSIPPARIDALVQRARPVLGLPGEAVPTAAWSGLRPAIPDGLPVVGRIAEAPAFVVASGHGMLGTSMGPGTGELVADLLSGRAPALDLAPLAPTRFTRSGRLG